MQSREIIVVGAGPAGLMAAVAAAEAGHRVIILERTSRPGLKLLASGGGRCNLTNTLPIEQFMKAFGRSGRFAQPALQLMGPDSLRAFLRQHGVSTHAPDGFHVFPTAEQSRVVLRALETACAKAGVVLRCGTPVSRLLTRHGGVTGICTPTGEKLMADAVVLATGGKTYPQLSGTEAGYELVRQVGHDVTPLYPVLVNLTVQETWPRNCAGASLDQAEVWMEAAPRNRVRGSILFTHDGLSGPAILDISREVVPELESSGPVSLRLHIPPPPGRANWEDCFAWWRQTRGRKTVTLLLDEVLPASVARALAREAQITPRTTAAQLAKAQQASLVNLLERAPLTVIGSGGAHRAMVTRGGVSLKQVEPRTLQSRLVQGLFMAGEMLDLDGPCGGFNLQWAFASGWLAGRSATLTRADGC